MAKNLEVSVLLDYYGSMLTQKQRKVLDYYYNDDLSLAEIAENEGITRQGVRDAIKRGETQLFEMEDHLGFLKRFREIKESLQIVDQSTHNIQDYNKRFLYNRDITGELDKILSAVENLNNLIEE
ncbi:YlxM family DNA-binding protein [Caproicibacterium sp. NSD3]